VKVILSWISILAAFLAAGLWWYAASINVPTNIQSGFGALVGVEEMSVGFKCASNWNRLAALATGIAVFFQAIALMLPL
jgi:hypothetical protein